VTTTASSEASATARTTTDTTPVTPPAPPPLTGLGALVRSLNRQLAHAGPNVGASVYDITSRTFLFRVRDDVPRPPASVEKLYTSIALLRLLGPGARLPTTVLGAGHLASGGVWHGNLYLHGGGDPTFGDGGFNRTWELGYGPTPNQLVEQLQADGIRRVTGSVIGDASLLDGLPGGPATGYAPDVPDFGGQLSALTFDHGSTSGSLSPGAYAARQLARTMRASRVYAKAAPRTGVAPRDTRLLATVSSPPLSVLLKLMDVSSDDLFAELLTKQLGVRFGGAGSITAGARVIAGQIAQYGLHPNIVDGSGLSRSDASSPRDVLDLLRAVWHTPVGNVLRDSLPILGETGTVAAIATKTPAQGHCIAKTGSLTSVTNLAGYCQSRGRQTVAFAIFIDGPPNWSAFELLGRMVAAIARY
jgi:D-alanyl-D-alanine carboxypeptidase/D-alanyl-D-alanine-endopeptidase (penicillin-binding protein 4)